MHNEYDFENNLGVLTLLTEALTQPKNLDEALSHITTITTRLLDTEQAVFLFRDEASQELIVRSVVGIDSLNVRVGHKLNVPDRLRRMMWMSRSLHQIGRFDTGIDDIQFPIIMMPVLVRGARVGILIAGGARNKDMAMPFDGVRCKLFSLITHFASLVIENSKVYDYLKQHFAATSQELQAQIKQSAVRRSEAEQLMVTSLKNPSKVVQLLTESFFKELVLAGFSAGHVVTAAAHLLELVTQADVDSTGKLTVHNS